MIRSIAILYVLILTPSAILAASGPETRAELYFISPADGETLQNPVVVRFGLKNMGVAPAGANIANTGHHHLLIDTELPAMHLPIGKDDKHRHFGGGQTEASIELEPGTHTLQLLLGDFSHIPHDPAVVSKQITITVE
ncbi:MAG: hypothetical protein ACI9SC_000797 [Gammaproteobacteria bacterium]|jgi:hypothetical protein